MLEFMSQHQFWTAVAGYWIFSAAVGSMPEPATSSSPGYRWVYRFLHTLAGNIGTAFGSRIPGLKAVALLCAIPLSLAAPACAAHYTIHPGSLSAADSTASDVLLVAEAAIDQARTEYAAAQLPAQTKDALNTLIRSYNAARDSWLTYRGAIEKNVPAEAYMDRLTKNLSDLSKALRAFKEAQ